jgi:hypothetical protein
LQQILQGIAPSGQKHEQGREQQETQEQMQNGIVRGMVHHRDDDADDEKGEGHAQQQRVEFTTFGEKCGKDAVERGHNV